MDLNQLHPFAGNHAVQNAVFAIDWTDDLASAELSALEQELKERFLVDFPRFQQQISVTFTMVAGPAMQGATGPTPVPEVGGFSFERIGNAGQVMRAIQIAKTQCLLVIGDYSRWTDVWKSVSDYLGKILPTILKTKSIAGIGLQYIDSFTWRAAPKDWDTSAVFRNDSEYLPPHAFKAESLWHSHHGFFSDIDGPNGYRRLDNVNVNVAEANGFKTVQIVTSHQAALTNQIFPNTTDYADRIGSIYSLSHECNTKILSRLLHVDVCKKIGLDIKPD